VTWCSIANQQLFKPSAVQRKLLGNGFVATSFLGNEEGRSNVSDIFCVVRAGVT
jgi:hypothetical protein